MKYLPKKIISIFILSLIVFVIFFMLVLKFKSKTYYGDIYKKDAADFSLTDHNGRQFKLSDHKGKIVLMNFGYTSCPDVCPTTLAILRNIILEIEDSNDNLIVLFITVDPERDTVEKLKSYIPYFHNEIVGLTGNEEDIRNVASIYNIIYFKEDEKSDKEYLMSHSPSVYLINKEGELFLKYPQHKLDPKEISKDIKLLM
ncbi:MAG: redoxin domain-containing protein [Candidatus Dadabacteria bacterium]|nr:redoxin domain-containing protein [Candidatus Dadabacteria bacterium]NIQ14850.1 redoxin domain-containing protein [Candidatus Dadabacteria bacterium]